MNKHAKRFVLAGVGAVLILVGTLFGGAGMTAYAAQSALPGDALYPVKTTIEQTRISLSRDAANRADLHLTFAERRLQELSDLIADGRYRDVQAATSGFEAAINQAILELDTVAQGDAQRAAVLTAQISEALSSYARATTSMLNSVPDQVRDEMRKAVEAVQGTASPSVQPVAREFRGEIASITAGAWIIGGQTIFIHSQTEVEGAFQVGDYVKVHAVLNGDGDLVAREIEAAERPAGTPDDNDNGNESRDDNSDDVFGDDNGNDDLGDDNDNDSPANDNSSDDDDEGNGNDDAGNLNDNNGKDDSNSNESSNSNDSVDDDGSNSNESLNSNDSIDDNGNADDGSGSNSNDGSSHDDNDNGSSGDDNGNDDSSRDDDGNDDSSSGINGNENEDDN